jgi:hypothetical protein
MPARIPTVQRIVGRLRVTIRGRNALFHVFELWVGLAGMVSGIAFFYEPASIDHNAISQTIGHSVSEAWVISYMLAGAAIWFGLLRPSPRWEAVGLWLLGTTTSVNAIAIAAVFGWRGAPTAATILALTAAAWTRAVLVQLDTIRLANLHDEGAGGGRR